jgi:hypothetical protein
MNRELYAHKKILRKKEVERQDAVLNSRLLRVKGCVDNREPEGLRQFKNSKGIFNSGIERERIAQGNELLLGRIEAISRRKNKSRRV